MAMELYSLLVGIGFIIAFPSVGQAAIAFGWRATWLGVGIVLTAVMAPLGWFVLGRSEASVKESMEPAATGSADDLTLRDALLSPAFWVFAFASSLVRPRLLRHC